MKSDILLVSSLPPTICGVGTYAQEHLNSMREKGCNVTTASPNHDSVADIHFDTNTLGGVFRWLRFCAMHRYEIVHVHYVDHFFFQRSKYGHMHQFLLRCVQSLSLRLLASNSSHSRVVIHEIPTSRNLGRRFYRWREFGLSSFSNVEFHTPSMRDDFIAVYTGVSQNSCEIVSHERFMRHNFSGSKEAARKHLSLSPTNTIFLCLGFVQKSKGFDEVVEAFGKSMLGDTVELHVVGSSHSNAPIEMRYSADLEKACKNTPNCQFHGDFLNDEDFDCWLAAADLLFLPYRSVTSSGVGARAEIHGCPIVIRSIPGLVDQFPHAERFTETGELQQIMKFHA
jgi:glycosyltransferase involved in cell wall biosynthesis